MPTGAASLALRLALRIGLKSTTNVELSFSEGPPLLRCRPVKRRTESHRKPAQPERPVPLGKRREIFFRTLAVLLVPAVLFAILECGLRLAGYGYPTDFFRETQIANRARYVENDQFGRRFFPRSLVRIPSPTVFPVVKATNHCRIFVLGESAALGDPEPAFGFGRYLEVLLHERFPQTEFEVVSAAMTAINSHALRPIARDCARRDGDLWVIYMGNNEVVGPFGAGTVVGPKSPPLSLIRASLALKTTRTGQLLDAMIDRLAPTASTPTSWQGMKMFLDAKTRHDEPGRRRTDEHFAKNLNAILRTARQAGVPVILCTVATNLKDCAPFASLHSAGFTEDHRRNWEPLYRAGTDHETAGQWREAIEQYQQAAAIDGAFAELQFRLGRCHLALNQAEQAKRHFELARDFDALPFRATSTQNEIVRAAAREFADDGVVLLDAAETLTTTNSPGIAGTDLFYEHVHLNFAGNQSLARLVAGQAAALLPRRFTDEQPHDWPSSESCDHRLGVTLWDRHRVHQNVLQRERQPPFTLQLNHTNQIENLSDELRALRSQMNSNTLADARMVYQEAVRQRPDDFALHGNYARLLEETGDFSEAIVEWKRVGELLPYHFGPDFYLGKLLARIGRLDEAEPALTRTLQLRPDTVEAMDELGRVLIRQKKTAAAIGQFNQALKLQPDNARLHLQLAEALAAQNQLKDAIASLRRAIQLRPDYWEARYFLGVELAVGGNLSGAKEQFTEVVRLKPDHVSAHLNLGVALAKQNRLPEAIARFRETLRLDPTNRMALDYLSKLRAD